MTYKIVRNKVPANYEKDHGKKAVTRKFYGPSEENYYSREKICEEVQELFDAPNIENAYEEAADVYAALMSYLEFLDKGKTKREVHDLFVGAHMSKTVKLGSMSHRILMSVSDEDKEFYYNNIKGKITDEHGKL